MNAIFKLKIYNNTDLSGTSCQLSGTVGNNIVTLQIQGTKGGTTVVELSASELILAASRLSAGPDGLCAFPSTK
jgi:hypothetical protein